MMRCRRGPWMTHFELSQHTMRMFSDKPIRQPLAKRKQLSVAIVSVAITVHDEVDANSS
jgi:hypothetical protein